MSSDELEILFKSISKKKPSNKSLNAIKDYPNQRQLINFLIDKLKNYIDSKKTTSSFEWGIIHSVGLLGDIKAVESVESLVSIMDMVKDDYLVILYSYTINALSKMGNPALEPIYKKYLMDQDNKEYCSVWLSILAKLGVKDKRIYDAIIRYYEYDPVEAINLMGDYKDKSFLPIVKKFVKKATDTLNAKKINPFKVGIRFEEPEANAYINTREVWIELETGLDIMSEELKRKVEELDYKLLKYADKTDKYRKHDILQEMNIENIIQKDIPSIKVIKKSLEKSFKELKIENAFGKTVAILLAALSYPDILSFNILYPKIYNKEDVVFDNMEQANILTQSIMDLWNKLVSCYSPEELKFLEYDGELENYIRERHDEIGKYLEIILFKNSSDIYRYTKDSQIGIKYIEEEFNELKKVITDKELSSSINITIIQERVINIWHKMFLIKSFEDINRKKRMRESGYHSKMIRKKVSRNEPCPCGSGKKYKHCCMN